VLWWSYFDWWTLVAEDRLAHAPDGERAALARDMYSYLHLPLVAGIVLVALAMKKTLGAIDEPLKAVPAAALCGGLALYLLVYTALRLRIHRQIARGRLTAAVAVVALYPLVREVSALTALVPVAAVAVGLIVYEAVRYREQRAQIRARGLGIVHRAT